MSRTSIYGIILWNCIILLSLLLNIREHRRGLEDVLNQSATAFYTQVVLTREWNARHGGVYVPVTDATLPNPYLKDSDRDIVTIQGKKYTKINPAYMTRQISEIADKELGIKFHITSLKPIRPGNAPRPWERDALESFEKGALEFRDIRNAENGKEYRYMAPLKVKESCLKCHSEQGYTSGDVRGGISVVIPFKSPGNLTAYLSHGSAAVLVSLLIAAFGIRSERSRREILNEKNRAEAAEMEQRELLQVLCHDLTNHFGAIRSILELVEGDPDSFMKIRNELYLSANNGLELINLVKEMRELADKLGTRSENLFELISNSLIMLRFRMSEKGIQVILNVDRSHRVKVERTSFVNSVMNNILTNAVKFSRPGSAIDISSKRTGGLVIIEVKDRGVGIPATMIPHLFDIKNSRSRRGTWDEKGTGYGLPMVKKFITIYGGRIEIETSEKNLDSREAGTTVRLMLQAGDDDKSDYTTST